MSEWLWKKYERTWWEREGGARLYVGHFQREVPPEGKELRAWKNLTVAFWAHHPVLAMRHILQTGKDPMEFHGAEIN